MTRSLYSELKTADDITDEIKLQIIEIFKEAMEFSFERNERKGYINQTAQQRPNLSSISNAQSTEEAPTETTLFYRYMEFHPMKFEQYKLSQQTL